MKISKAKRQQMAAQQETKRSDQAPAETKPDWKRKCMNCGASPIVPVTGMCGPCTFGEADTADGNW
jgi:CO dehydrogenase/acetyl-CoA synthase alpha subunit